MSLLPLPEPIAEHVVHCESCGRLIRSTVAVRLGRGPKCERKLHPPQRRLRARKPAPVRGQPGPDLFDQFDEGGSMQDPEQHPPADSLAEAIQAADDAICRLNGVPDPLAHQDWDHDDVADAAVRAAAPILRAEGRREADGAILWNTTCIGCAKQLDTLYAERVAGAEDVLGDVVGLLVPNFPAAADVVRQWAARQALAVREPSGDGLDVLAEPAVRAVEATEALPGAGGADGPVALTAPSGAANALEPDPSPTMSTTTGSEESS